MLQAESRIVEGNLLLSSSHKSIPVACAHCGGAQLTYKRQRRGEGLDRVIEAFVAVLVTNHLVDRADLHQPGQLVVALLHGRISGMHNVQVWCNEDEIEQLGWQGKADAEEHKYPGTGDAKYKAYCGGRCCKQIAKVRVPPLRTPWRHLPFPPC